MVTIRSEEAAAHTEGDGIEIQMQMHRIQGHHIVGGGGGCDYYWGRGEGLA